MRKSIKHFAAVMIAIMTLTLFMPVSVYGANKSTDYYLPTKVTVYKYKGGKWVKWYSESYKYNKKRYISKWTYSDKETGTEKGTNKYEYYSDGTLKKKTLSGGESYVFSKKGHVTKYRLASGKIYERYKYKGSRLSRFYDGYGWYDLVYTDHQDGSVARIDASPEYFDSDDPSEAWCEFDENGLLIKEGSEISREGQNVTYQIFNYKYKYDKKGRVTSAVEYYKGKKDMKTVFSYSKAPKTKDRIKYIYSINSCAGYLNYGMRAAVSEGKVM